MAAAVMGFGAPAAGLAETLKLGGTGGALGTINILGVAFAEANPGVTVTILPSLDVLILDLRIPVINGLDVFMALKKQGRKVPTIIVTGYADEEAAAIKTLLQEKASGCLIKPFDPLKLLEAIEATKDSTG